jgi:hypothetical protein
MLTDVLRLHTALVLSYLNYFFCFFKQANAPFNCLIRSKYGELYTILEIYGRTYLHQFGLLHSA